MTFNSASDLVSALRTYRLLEPAQLQQLERRLQPQPPEPRALARDLLQQGWLTAYQINQLFLGRGPDLLLGDYMLLERLGEGSMGSVFKARHRKSGRPVALKLVRKDRLGNSQAVARFQREIDALASLDHPNVVLAHEVDQAGDTLFLVMEYVEGTDLKRLVEEHGPLPVWQACDYLRQAALGLQHAHERGLVHRDIKPSNLMVTVRAPGEAGVVKLLDLGLARLVGPGDGEEGPALTKLTTVLGTPDYISPEQARDSRNVDIRGDLYSLGCTLYHLLAGQPPFPGGEPVDKLLKHCSEEPPPVEEVRRRRLTEARRSAGQPPPVRAEVEVPPEVVAVLQRLMAKEPEDRYQTPAEVAGVLTALLPADAPIPAPLPPAELPPADEPPPPPAEDEAAAEGVEEPAATDGLPSFEDYRSPVVPGTWLVVAVVCATLFLMLAMLFLAWASQHEGRGHAAAGPPPYNDNLAARKDRPARVTRTPREYAIPCNRP
jgi:serine/threonine-protein kinase